MTSEETPLVGSEDDAEPQPFSYVLFTGIRFVAVIACVAHMVSQALTLLILDEDIFQLILRIYVFLFMIGFICAEMDWFQSKLTFLVGFLERGFLYTFVGLVGIEEAKTVRIATNAKTHKVKVSFTGSMGGVFVTATSLAIFAIGCLYILMGAMCLRKVHDRVLHREENA